MTSRRAVLLACALAWAPAASAVAPRAPARAPAAPAPGAAALGVLGAFRASLEAGLGLPPGASAATPLPTLHLSAFEARREGGGALAALSPAGHAKMAALVQALGPRAGLEAAAAARAEPLAPGQARALLAAFDAALAEVPAASLKDPASASAAADALWEGVRRRASAVPAPAGAVAAKTGLRPAEKPGAPARRLSPPLVTGALVAANAGVYAASAAGWLDTSGWGLSLSALARAWESGGPLEAAGQYLSSLTALFTHASLSHLLHNALGLALVGAAVEAVWGSRRTLALFLAAGVAAHLVFAAAYWGAPFNTRGASGALMGLAGAYLVVFVADISKRKAAGWRDLVMLGLFTLAANVVFQALGDVWGVALQWGRALGEPLGDPGRTNYLAHLVGLLTGLLGARYLLGRDAAVRAPRK